MKKISRILIFILVLIMLLNVEVIAHGGNITGWKDKDSIEIIQYNGKYYGYHNKEGVRHYHQVGWNEEKQKWEIVKTAVCYDENFNIINNTTNSSNERIEVTYSESIDGDTAKFKLNEETIIVRFLGIDTPETVHPSLGEQPYGKEGSNYTKEKLQNANKIELEYDSNSSKTDKYGRHLVWIWVDDSLLQEELIREGLAQTYMLQDNYTYAWILQEKQEEAKQEKVGIWSDTIESNINVINNNETKNNLDNEVIGIVILGVILLIVILIGKDKQKNRQKNK
ncbi:MAG: thermonuclease family protein [Clostridia bacterium]|jgi:endonuclease YncB( thermonuclease family)|nr:thermonuclease family protein [Clostridia bacterium]